MLKYNIEKRIVSVKGKHPNQVIKELQKLLNVGPKRLLVIRKAEIGSTSDAKGEQLGIIAKYFKCKVNDLYTAEWFATLPTVKKLDNNAVQSAAS